ncbi:hypothetical protein EV356DRAFT_496849 [Viridothelium virens]|uniref:Uncharacterized protein n=1 Tax=Viridothelium virens TaxID=1048519 RepID=A0A6A6HGM3_VIRVR|nr:hypothetical protein EV356DRAFT_496849 [Viridothelium virens]
MPYRTCRAETAPPTTSRAVINLLVAQKIRVRYSTYGTPYIPYAILSPYSAGALLCFKMLYSAHRIH